MTKPIYKNLVTVDGSTVVMRYMSLAQLVSLLVNKSLPLTRLDQFADRFEGSIPKRQQDDQIPLFSSSNSFFFESNGDVNVPRRDMFTEVARWRKALVRSAHASCWRSGRESEGMWRLYSGDREGVALQTTFAQLEASVASTDLLVGRVQYRNYKTGDPFNDELDPLMFKRDGFDFEQEVRLLSVNRPHYEELRDRGDGTPPLAERMSVPWAIGNAINHIRVSPYASDMYGEAVQAAVAALSPTLAPRISRSELWGEPAF